MSNCENLIEIHQMGTDIFGHKNMKLQITGHSLVYQLKRVDGDITNLYQAVFDSFSPFRLNLSLSQSQRDIWLSYLTHPKKSD